jgi:hypothetical protein
MAKLLLPRMDRTLGMTQLRDTPGSETLHRPAFTYAPFRGVNVECHIKTSSCVRERA